MPTFNEKVVIAAAETALDVQNTTNAASNQVAIFRAGNRTAGEDGDEGYFSFYLDDSNGNPREVARMAWKFYTAQSGGPEAYFSFQPTQAGSLFERVRIGGLTHFTAFDAALTAVGPVEIRHGGSPCPLGLYTTGGGSTGSVDFGVARFVALRDAPATNGDSGYIQLRVKQSDNDDAEFGRITWRAQEVTATNKSGEISFSVMTGGVLVEKLRIRGHSPTVTAGPLLVGNTELTSSTLPLDVTHTGVGANAEVMRIRAPGRLNATNGDAGYVSLYSKESGGASAEFARLRWIATDVSASSKDAEIAFSVQRNNTLTEALKILGEGIVLPANATTDTAPNNDNTPKKLTIQRRTSAPTNAAYLQFSNFTGAGGEKFYLVLEEG